MNTENQTNTVNKMLKKAAKDFQFNVKEFTEGKTPLSEFHREWLRSMKSVLECMNSCIKDLEEVSKY